jgi:hypothetical protein
MQLPNNDNSSVALGARRCPMCAKPMFLLAVDPADKPGYDQRSFECSGCDYAETVQFKHFTERGMITNW